MATSPSSDAPPSAPLNQLAAPRPHADHSPSQPGVRVWPSSSCAPAYRNELPSSAARRSVRAVGSGKPHAPNRARPAARPRSGAPAWRSTPPRPTGAVVLSVTATVIPGPVPPHARPGAAGRGQQPRRGHLGPHRVTPTPGAPQDLRSEPGDAEVTLRWAAPASDGGSAILRYEYAIDDSGTWIDAGGDLEETVPGLTNGQSYAVAVRAVNAAGAGPAATVTASPVTTPGATQRLRSEPGDAQVSRESQELACAVEAGYGDLPRPNVAAQRASSGHLHLGWNLRTPVHRGAASRPRPLAALGRIAEYYAVTLRSDRGYVGVLAYNPVHGDYNTVYPRSEPYDLAELARALPAHWRRPARAADLVSAPGRNCHLFAALCKLATRGSDEGLLTWVRTLNSEFAVPLPESEVRGIWRSVCRYRARWRVQGHQQGWLWKQAARGRKGGLIGGLRSGVVRRAR